MLDADERAILFLCCDTHGIACPRCGRHVLIGRLLRTPPASDRYRCPECRADATDAVVAHTRACDYFLSKKPLGRIGRDEARRAAGGPA
jgi:predicted RNA-binding Zn-ribbon protein involved in translation (DUF1610 family)